MYPNTFFLGMGLYEIFIAIGLLAAILVADRMAIKKGFSIPLQKMLLISTMGAVAIGFVGAILFQAFYNYLETGEFSLHAGMTFYGGFIFGVGGFLLMWLFVSKGFGVQKEAISRTRDVADMAGAVVPLAHAFGRIGCLFAGCCHGNVADKWYGINMLYGWDEKGNEIWVRYVPVQLFEALFLFVLAAGLFFLLAKRNAVDEKRVPTLPLYFVAYAVWRFSIEFARGDERGSSPIPFLTPSQFIAVILFAVGVGYLAIWMYRKRIKKEQSDGKNVGDGSV